VSPLHRHDLDHDRRTFLRHAALGTAAFATPLFSTPGLFAEELLATPTMTEGPFYPDKLPLDTDNDLLIVNQSITPAIGEIAYLSGRVLNARGEPLRNAFVEIWQCDGNGRYLHTASADEQSDANFQGYGRFLTAATGDYFFRTIKPVPYPGRTPHIHVAVSRNGRRIFTSQVLIKGEPQNERDGVFRSVQDPQLRDLVAVDFAPIKESKLGELKATFDVVLGVTPVEDEQGRLVGGIGKSQWNARPAGPRGGEAPPR
jgi:protocatechuate 3,4-dioxygenase, beta subunit